MAYHGMKKIISESNERTGRWNRYRFWIYPLAIAIVIYIPLAILTLVFGMLFSENSVMFSLLGFIYIIVYVYMLYVSIFATVKRLHDLNKTGWMVLLSFVPLANIYLFIICGFFKGTVGPNQYGADPLNPDLKEIVSDKMDKVSDGVEDKVEDIKTDISAKKEEAKEAINEKIDSSKL